MDLYTRLYIAKIATIKLYSSVYYYGSKGHLYFSDMKLHILHNYKTRSGYNRLGNCQHAVQPSENEKCGMQKRNSISYFGEKGKESP